MLCLVVTEKFFKKMETFLTLSVSFMALALLNFINNAVCVWGAHTWHQWWPSCCSLGLILITLSLSGHLLPVITKERPAAETLRLCRTLLHITSPRLQNSDRPPSSVCHIASGRGEPGMVLEEKDDKLSGTDEILIWNYFFQGNTP